MGIWTALVGVFGRATAAAMVVGLGLVPGGLRLRLRDSLRLGIVVLDRLDRAAFEGVVGELAMSSSLRFDEMDDVEDFGEATVVLDVEGDLAGGCWREYM